MSNCTYGTSVKLSLIVHTDKNHYGYKCPEKNCTYFTSDKKDSTRHKLAVHTKKSQFDPKLMESLVEETKHVRVSDDAKTKYDKAKLEVKYEQAKAKMR